MNRRMRPAALIIKSASAAGTAAVLSFAGMALFGIDTASGQSTNPTCSLSGQGALSIDLFGGTVTISDDGTNFVVSPSASCAGPYPVASVTVITFGVDTSAGLASTVVLDLTANEFPSSPCVPIIGTVGNTTAGLGTVDVLGANGENITVGSHGVNLEPGVCDGSVGTLAGVRNYQLDDTTTTAPLSAVTLSAAGGAGTGSATTVPVAISGGTATQHLDGSTFIGGAGMDTFIAAGTGNRFLAGTGNATFSDATAGNTVDFSALTIPVVVNVSGVQVGSTQNDTATAGSATDTFTGLGSPSTFIGATSGGTTFYAGSDADTFTGHGLAGDTLSYGFAPGGPLQINAATGAAQLGATTEPFSGIQVFDGLTAGNTTFVSGATGGYTFNATGSGNAADFSAATTGVPGVTIDLSTTPAMVSGFATGGPDVMSGISTVTGSAAGQNTFRAGSSNASFAQTGPGVGDTIDFSPVATSQSTPLTVNVSGAPVGGLANDSASVGTTTYTFTTGGAAFTRFTGATNGNTDFLASGAGGYAFNGRGTPNTLDLSASPAGTVVTVNRNSAAKPGHVSKLNAGVAGKRFDTFTDVQYFAGAVSFVSPVRARPTTLPHATLGAMYSVQLNGAGGTSPYRDWSVENGSLPPGLTLSASGVLSGIPTATGTFSFVVTLVDAHNIVGATRFTLVVT
jgi:hypothetical protein